jgi:hypothetical protein
MPANDKTDILPYMTELASKSDFFAKALGI